MPHIPTIDETAQAIRSRTRTCVEVVQQCLTQIDRWEPQIHAWVSVDRERALARASELDAELARGKILGPLHGIPLGIKDLVDVAGWPTACGSALLAREKAMEDAEIVGRLRGAGAIILGKTVTTQFACFDPPPTRNPWNLDRTPGGSSSGSAAAVATGMCLGAIGSQTGGSITRPASFCGVAGCKPTIGGVSTRGIYPVAPSLDHPGPIARCVTDLKILLDVILEQTPVPTAVTGTPTTVNSPRIGRLAGMFAELAEPAAATAFDAACHKLATAGAVVSDARLPAEFDNVIPLHRVIMTSEIAAGHETRLQQFPGDYLPGIRGLIEEGLRVPAAEYIRARQHQEQLRSAIRVTFKDCDVLACPAAIGPAPDRATTGDPVFNSPWSYTGLPTVAFPIGFSSDGLPLAIQLVGRPFEESTLFRVALRCERQFPPLCDELTR